MMKTFILALTFSLLFLARLHLAEGEDIERGQCEYVQDTSCVLPSGVIDARDHGDFSFASTSISIPQDVDIEEGSFYQNTFEFTEKHVKLFDSGNETIGVRFNVETVPAALSKHLNKPVMSRDDALDKIRSGVAAQYCRQRLAEQDAEKEHHGRRPKNSRCTLRSQDIRIEAASEHGDTNLIYTGGNGFLVASLTAFAQHLPLQLSPDHIWSLITYAFAKHVDTHAEALRHKFVQHKGKKRILIDTGDGFQMSRNDDPDSGASAKEWEQIVFAQFSRDIKAHIGEETHKAITADFSSTTAASRAATEIVLMTATKNYFSFGMLTACGIPSITLLGSEADWVALRQRTKDLEQLMLPEFTSYWMPLVLPILDEFIESYRGKVNHGFWQSMVKLRDTGPGSGRAEFVSGWMQIFFPYLASGMNHQLRPWNEMYFSGPRPEQFPSITSSVPVDWDYHGIIFNMDFHAGMTGVSQVPSDGTLSPVVGWYVTHSPPRSAQERFREITEEIAVLLEGHKEEAEADEIDERQPWFQRVSTLRREHARLREEMTKNSISESMT